MDIPEYVSIILTTTVIFVTRFIEIAFVSIEYEIIKDIVMKKRFIKTVFLQWFKHANILMASLQFIRYLAEIALLVLLINHHSLYFALVGFAIILIFGEYVPRTLAMQKGIRYVYYLYVPFLYLCYFISPLVRLLMFPADIIIKMCGGTMVFNIPYLTKIEEQIITNVLTEETDTQESEMLASVLEFKDTVVREIMVPRVDIVAISADLSYEEMIAIVTENNHSRVPVYEDRMDNLLGVLYIKDLLAVNPKKFSVKTMLHEPYFVPETKKINHLLREFQAKHMHMAFVVDEYGGLVGLATIEDILEEIVGEIADEYDEDEELFTKLNDHEYLLSPKMTLEVFDEVFNIDIEEYAPDNDESYETIAGFIISLLGNLPKKGYEHDFGDFKMKVLDVDKRRILKILLTLNEALRPEEDA